MNATLKPPVREAGPPPVTPRKVPVIVRPSADEKKAQLRRDRVSAVVAILFILGLIALVVWAAMTGELPETDSSWDYPYPYLY